jgi:TRIAP1/MDM35 family protein
MESLDPKCTELKAKYENCFRSWYSGSYLTSTDPSEVIDDCAGLFKEYRTCLNAVLKEKGIDKMLEEQQANDAIKDNII